jgi:hypothetical protein
MESKVCSHKYLEELEIGLCCLSCGTLRNFVSETPDTSAASNTQPGEEYQYSPLRPDQIRLIVLHPGAESDPISCQIITIQLQSGYSYRYEAVSYTWATEDGDARKVKSIQVYDERGNERKYIKVTTNCENALRQLRRHRTKSNRFDQYLLWVDSICINQDRISERNHQVSIMDQIYMNAVQVDVCINAYGQDYRGAMKLLDHDAVVKQDVSDPGVDLLRFTKSVEEYFPDKDQPRHDLHPYFMQLASLFRLRYFSRVWVVQEILLSQKAFLYVNNEIVPFEEQILRIICDTCVSRSISIPWLFRWVSVWNKAPGIILCLDMSLNCSASDARDRIFAITGLPHPCTRAMIPIDYISSVQEVLATAVTACIAECGDLDILSYARLPKGADPHTAPSLNMAQFKAFLSRQGSRGALDPSQAWERYDQARSLFSWYRPSIAMRDGCKRCGPLAHNATALDSTCAFQCTSWSPKSTFEQLDLPIPETQILPRLMVQAYPIDICCGSTDQSVPNYIAQLQQAFPIHKCTGPKDERLTSFIAQRQAGRESYAVQEPYPASLRDVITDLGYAREQMWAFTDYTVFRTQWSVGFTSGHCLHGDIVATVDGATHAFVLRSVGSRRFRIVGDCYLWNQFHVAHTTKGWWVENFSFEKQDIEIY